MVVCLPAPIEGIEKTNIAATALRGKASETLLNSPLNYVRRRQLSADGDADHIRTLTQSGGNMEDSYIHRGLV